MHLVRFGLIPFLILFLLTSSFSPCSAAGSGYVVGISPSCKSNETSVWCTISLGAYSTMSGSFELLTPNLFVLSYALGYPPIWYSTYAPSLNLYFFLTQLYVPDEPPSTPVPGAALVAFNLTSKEILYTVTYSVPDSNCPFSHSFCWYIPTSITFDTGSGMLLVNMNLFGTFTDSIRDSKITATTGGFYQIDPFNGALSYLSDQPLVEKESFPDLVSNPTGADLIYLQASNNPETSSCSKFYFLQWNPQSGSATKRLHCVGNQPNLFLDSMSVSTMLNSNSAVTWTVVNSYSQSSLLGIDPIQGNITNQWWNLPVTFGTGSCPIIDLALSPDFIYTFSPNSCELPDSLYQIVLTSGERTVLGIGARLQAIQYVTY